MSYCVNCGVELHESLKECPLCNTPVVNPRELSTQKSKGQAVSSFPREKGQVEGVKRTDVSILLTTVVVATAVVCGLLNWLVYDAVPWSLAIIGACVLLWVILLPAAVNTGQSVYASLMLDGAAAALYLFMLTFLTGSSEWFRDLGFPITLGLTVLAEVFTLLLKKVSHAFLPVALYSFTSLAIVCVGLEILIDRAVGGEIAIGWSSVVLTVCAVVDIAVITLLSRKRLRNAVRRRLHF